MDTDLFEMELLSDALVAWEKNKEHIDLKELSSEFQKSMHEPYSTLLKKIHRMQTTGDELTPERIMLNAAIVLCRDPRDLFGGVNSTDIESETEEAPL